MNRVAFAALLILISTAASPAYVAPLEEPISARRSSGEVLARCEPFFDFQAGLPPRTEPEQRTLLDCADLFGGYVTAYCAAAGHGSVAPPPVERAAAYWRGYLRFDPYAAALPFASTMTGALISSRICDRPEGSRGNG